MICVFNGGAEQAQGLKSSCRISVVPSTLALASAAAALGAWLFSAKFSDDQLKYIYIGSAVGFVGFSAVSYPLGGHACRKSNKSTFESDQLGGLGRFRRSTSHKRDSVSQREGSRSRVG